MRAARDFELWLAGRRPITWLLFRHLVKKTTAGYGDGIKATSWPENDFNSVHTWKRLMSVKAATNYLRFDARICLRRPLGQCVFRLTSAQEQGENWSERQVDTVLCAGADAQWSRKGTQFHCLKFRLGSAGEPTICSHCYDVLNEDYAISFNLSQWSQRCMMFFGINNNFVINNGKIPHWQNFVGFIEVCLTKVSCKTQHLQCPAEFHLENTMHRSEWKLLWMYCFIKGIVEKPLPEAVMTVSGPMD